MMGNLLKKVTAGVLSLAFFGMQITFADELTGGQFAGRDVLDNAAIQGHTDGLTNVQTNWGNIWNGYKNNATLTVNKDTRIDWAQLNVGSRETLNFDNGANVVLNNVLGNSMSTFEGMVTSTGSGQIIIANPNGILLQGGKFETAGALMLTTKDLTGSQFLPQNGKFVNLENNINDAKYTNDYAVVTIKGDKVNVFGSGDSKIKAEAGDINILAQKIDISNADIVGKNGVVLSTSDGMNFVASNNESIKVVDSNINGATSAIAKGGVVEFRTNGNINVENSDINALKVAKANDVNIKNADINKLNVENSNNVSLISNLFHTINDIVINNTKGNVKVNNYKFDNLTANNTKDVTVNYTLEHSVKNDNITLNNVGNVVLDNVKIGNKLDVNKAGTVDIIADLAANSIENAVFKATGDLTIDNTDFNTLTTREVGNIKINDGLLSVNSIGTADLDSKGNVSIEKVNFTNPLKVAADGFFKLVNSTAEKAILNIGGDAVIESPVKNMTIADSNIGGNLTVDSKVHTIGSVSDFLGFFFGNEDMFADVNVDNTTVGGTATLTAWGNVNVNDSQLGGLNAISQLGGIDVADSHITGNATFTRPDSIVANIKEFVNDLFGKEYKENINSTNTAIDGEIYLTAAADANFTSPDSLHFVDPSVAGTLKAQADNKLTFEQTKSDLTVNNKFFDKYQLEAGNELSFVNPGHNLTAVESANDNFTAKLISFFGKNVNLDNIKANTIKAVADETVTANNIKVNTDNKWENILGKQNTVATFEGKTINSTNSNYNGEVVVNAGNATFIQNDGKILKVMDSNITDTLKVTSNGEIYVGSWDKVGNNGEATKIGSLNLDSTNKITIWDTNVAEDALLKASNTIGIYDSEFNTADMTANSVTSSNANYAGDIKVNANKADFNSNEKLSFVDTVVNVFKAHSNNDVAIDKNSTIGTADIKGNNVVSNAKHNGNIKVNADKAEFNSENKLSFVDSIVNAFKAHSNNDVTVDNNTTIGSADIKANNVTSDAKYTGNIKVNAANNATFNSESDLTFENPEFGNEFTANTKGNINYNKTGDAIVNEAVKLTGNNVNITADNVTVNGETIKANNVTLNAIENVIANNITTDGTLSIENAKNISVNNCDSDKLAIINPEDNRFEYAEIFTSNANTTEFANGELVYIDLTNASLFNNNRTAIRNSATNVDRVIIVPEETVIDDDTPVVNPDEDTTTDNVEENNIAVDISLSQEATKNMNNLSQRGIDTVLGSDFSPIAFAAHDSAKRGGIYKAAGDKIFKDTQEIVHITDRFNVDQY